MVVLVRQPRAQAADGGGGHLRQRARDVRVLGVDQRRDRHLVLREPGRVVEARPVVRGEQLGRVAQRRERAVLAEHPRVDVLAGEQLGRGLVVVREHALGRPARRAAVGPARLVQDRVERVAGEAQRTVDVVQERRRVGRQLEQVVQRLEARAAAEQPAELAQAAWRQAIAAGQPQLLGLQPVDEREHARAVVRVARVVALAGADHRRVGRAVGIVDALAERRQPAGDERLAQPLWREREVADDAHPAEALAEHAPALDAELAADPLGVADDRVGTEVRQVGRLLGRRHPRERADRRRAARAALVEHQHAVVLQRAIQPAGVARVARRPRRLVAGSALQVQQQRPLEPLGIGDLTREDRDPVAVRSCVVERDRELVLDEVQARRVHGDGHAAIVHHRAAALRPRSVLTSRRRPCWCRSPRRPCAQTIVSLGDSFSSGEGAGGFYSYTRSGPSNTSSVCDYGFSGRTVWVTVDGVTSNQIGW